MPSIKCCAKANQRFTRLPMYRTLDFFAIQRSWISLMTRQLETQLPSCVRHAQQIVDLGLIPTSYAHLARHIHTQLILVGLTQRRTGVTMSSSKKIQRALSMDSYHNDGNQSLNKKRIGQNTATGVQENPVL